MNYFTWTTAELFDGYIQSKLNGKNTQAQAIFNEVSRRASCNARQKTIRVFNMLQNVINHFQMKRLIQLGNYNKYTHYQLTEVFCVALLLGNYELANTVKNIFARRADNGLLASVRRSNRINRLFNLQFGC